jgi:hypothetical protein
MSVNKIVRILHDFLQNWQFSVLHIARIAGFSAQVAILQPRTDNPGESSAGHSASVPRPAQPHQANGTLT